MTRRGFTLLELGVVLTILGLLAALLLPAVQMARESVRRIQCGSQMKSLIQAHHNYHESHNCFPTEWARGLRPYENSSGVNSGPTPAEFQCPSNVLEVDTHGEYIAQEEGSAWFNSPGLTSINCASAHIRGAHYGLADGSTRFISENIAEDVRVYLLLPNDGQVIDSSF